MNNCNPIGIFDSGVGGLTVAKIISNFLPNETIIYFGDIFHLPYGNKSKNEIQQYVEKIISFLLIKKVKMIIIACNSATAAFYEKIPTNLLKTKNIFLINAVDAVVKFLNNNYFESKLGLIGSEYTIESNIYQKKLSTLGYDKLHFLATPELVTLIENGNVNSKSMNDMLIQYLSNPILQDIKALILGCTHYNLIKHKIKLFKNIEIIDSSEIIAREAVHFLKNNNLLSSKKYNNIFYTSAYSKNFENMIKKLFAPSDTVKIINIF